MKLFQPSTEWEASNPYQGVVVSKGGYIKNNALRTVIGIESDGVMGVAEVPVKLMISPPRPAHCWLVQRGEGGGL